MRTLRNSTLMALSLIVVFTGSAQAETVIRSSGRTGAYDIPESRDQASVRVHYDDSTCLMDKIRVKPPVAYVINDISDHQDVQYLAWKFTIQRRIFDGSGIDYPWRTVYISPKQVRLAVEGETAGFLLMEVPFTGKTQSAYRVLTTIVWIKPQSQWENEGHVVLSNNWYSAAWSDPLTQHFWVTGDTSFC